MKIANGSKRLEVERPGLPGPLPDARKDSQQQQPPPPQQPSSQHSSPQGQPINLENEIMTNSFPEWNPRFAA